MNNIHRNWFRVFGALLGAYAANRLGLFSAAWNDDLDMCCIDHYDIILPLMNFTMWFVLVGAVLGAWAASMLLSFFSKFSPFFPKLKKNAVKLEPTIIAIKKAITQTDLAHCVQIRTLVFVVGQNVPIEREIDQDEENSVYFLGYVDGVPMGTVRWRRTGDMAKIERLAVRDEARGHGLARQLTQAVIADIEATPGIAAIKIGAQNYIIPFYESFGFQIVGEEYLEAGTIPHHDMIKTL